MLNYLLKVKKFFHFAGSTLDGFGGGSSTMAGGGRHASLLSRGISDQTSTLQMRETNLTGQKVNYLDSGYSEEGAPSVDVGDQQIASCLMKTSSGSIYIPPGNQHFPPNMDSRMEFRMMNRSPSNSAQSPTKDSYKSNDR